MPSTTGAGPNAIPASMRSPLDSKAPSNTMSAAAPTGCATLDRVNDTLASSGAFDLAPSQVRDAAPDCAVSVVAADRRGRGVITGARTVLTVAHVVGSATEVEVGTSPLSWTKAHVVRRLPASPEDLIELELDHEAANFLGIGGFESFEAPRHAR